MERPDQPDKPATSEPPKKRLSLIFVPESSSDEEEECIDCNVWSATGQSLLLPWKTVPSSGGPNIACLADKYLQATPAISVPCGSLFSLSGHVVEKKRAALSSENINRLDCLSEE